MSLKKIQSYARNNASAFTTYVTLILYIIGMVTFFSFFLSFMLFLFSMVMVTVAMQYRHFRYNNMTITSIWECLSTTYTFGVITGVCLTDLSVFGMFLILSCIRFYGEFQLINYFHHHELCWGSFLIYHSVSYTIANLFLIVQHIVTKYIFKFTYKQWHFLVIPSFIITTLAMIIRIAAFFTAQSNFTHKVAYVKKPNHRLVTSGIFSFLRHPSYTGFFYNTVCSMVMIGNFISAACFFVALSVFFQDRIQREENNLVEFFGQQYEIYRQHTYILIPYLPNSIRQSLRRIKHERANN